MTAQEQFIAAAGNIVVPSILALQAAGFSGRTNRRGPSAGGVPTGRYVAADPLELLGLIKLIEVRGWSWQATDSQIDSVLERFGWTG
ncbi:hypothetical protein ACWCOV_00330 [Kribbella sp. NPDC002412]